jgi:hypothetical protein
MPITSYPIISSLTEAITPIVTEFLNADNKFSIHNITCYLRDEINAGRLLIDNLELEDIYIQSVLKKDTQNLKHQTVKTEFLRMYTSGELKCESKDSYGLSYILYGKKPLLNPDTLTTIRSYLDQHPSPVIRQIHSILKIQDLTCEKLAKYFKQSSEFEVLEITKYPSKWAISYTSKN